ncbi:MAG: phosphoribosylanthranilate isomerase [Kiritimatiellae bacterium]|nr:phosphoribosylanthranilate isomerase [Kiritimatiellia bacterium]
MKTGVEIKICGLTTPAQATACAAAGADAIGIVFYRRSPRCVTPTAARAIVAALPAGFPVAGVFAHAPLAEIVATAAAAGIRIVQLHTMPENPLDYESLARSGLRVVQTLSCPCDELRATAAALPPRLAVLVECGRGPLPGGNGARWDWSGAAVLRGARPFAIAGGLDPANVAEALRASGADAVDASSSVECAPGIKDLARVRDFIAAVRAGAVRTDGGRSKVFAGSSEQ